MPACRADWLVGATPDRSKQRSRTDNSNTSTPARRVFGWLLAPLLASSMGVLGCHGSPFSMKLPLKSTAQHRGTGVPVTKKTTAQAESKTPDTSISTAEKTTPSTPNADAQMVASASQADLKAVSQTDAAAEPATPRALAEHVRSEQAGWLPVNDGTPRSRGREGVWNTLGEQERPMSVVRQVAHNSRLARQERLADDANISSQTDLAVESFGLAEESIAEHRHPVDLPTVLRLAGADNWSVRLAYERIREAQARRDAAKVLWVPSINAGVGYTKHEGQIQATPGAVVDVSRNSLFVGGGAGTGGAPLAGGAGGPARFQVDLSLADAIFEPLAARQIVGANQARHAATFNDTLLSASLAYYDLVGAQHQLAIANQNLRDSTEIYNLTRFFVAAGKGSRADSARAQVEASRRRQAVVRANMSVKVASAELARIVQLDPQKMGADSVLVPLEEQLVPVELVSADEPLPALVAQGQSTRPEVSEVRWRLAADRYRVRSEKWRPYIPNLHAGASAGAFGGGINDNLYQLDGRGDFDLLAVWQIKNFGLGNRAARDERNSQYRQSILSSYDVRDRITAEVTTAYHQVHAWQRQMQLAEENIDEANESFRSNIRRIRGLAGLPLESLQAANALAQSREDYLTALINYNGAQLRLLRAIGQPISEARAGRMSPLREPVDMPSPEAASNEPRTVPQTSPPESDFPFPIDTDLHNAAADWWPVDRTAVENAPGPRSSSISSR